MSVLSRGGRAVPSCHALAVSAGILLSLTVGAASAADRPSDRMSDRTSDRISERVADRAGDGTALDRRNGAGSTPPPRPVPPVNISSSPAPATPLKALPSNPSLDLRWVDKTVDPCQDFYQFACGGWQRAHPVPSDQASRSVYGTLQEDTLRYLWGLLQDAARDAEAAATDAPPAGPAAEAAQDRAQNLALEAASRRAGDYFAACMATERIEKLGKEPAEPLLAAVEHWVRPTAHPMVLAALHEVGVRPAVFTLTPEPDYADSSRMIVSFEAAALGLPDREPYLARDGESWRLRQAYREHLQRLFLLAGDGDEAAASQADAVLKLETKLATATASRESMRDPRQRYHPMKLDALQALTPSFDWLEYLSARALPETTVVNVTDPGFLRTLGKLLQSESTATWQAYLRARILDAEAPYLSSDWTRAHFEFHERRLLGIETMAPRWRHCIDFVDRDLGDDLGRLFVARTYSARTHAQVVDMTARIEQAMASRIRGLDWMSPATQEAALSKLRSVVNKIGHPQRWHDYAGLVIDREDFHESVMRARQHDAAREMAKVGQPVDRDAWALTAPTVNALYNGATNDITLPAGVLQPPLFDPSMDAAPNYGNTGATIGHELTHAFDDEGRRFDASGNLRDWWTPRDAAEFERRTACIAEQYSQYTIIDQTRINGRLTLGEDVADLGGTTLAYLAWKAAVADAPPPAQDGYTPDQRFFIGMAQWACENERPESQRLNALTDVHSPARFRVNGVVSNLPPFAEAFSCKKGQPMVRRKVCSVW